MWILQILGALWTLHSLWIIWTLWTLGSLWTLATLWTGYSVDSVDHEDGLTVSRQTSRFPQSAPRKIEFWSWS